MSRWLVSVSGPVALVTALLLAGGCQDQKEEARKNSAGQMQNGWTLLTHIGKTEGDAFEFPADHAAMKAKLVSFARSHPQLKGQLPEGGYGTSPLAEFVDGDPRPHYKLLVTGLDHPPGTALMMENPALHGGEEAAVLVARKGALPEPVWFEKAEAAELWKAGRSTVLGDSGVVEEADPGDGDEAGGDAHSSDEPTDPADPATGDQD